MKKVETLSDKALIRALSELYNKDTRREFHSLGAGNQVYTRAQKDFTFSLVNENGVRATSRILQVPRRTIQRWCRRYGKPVRRCPGWVYEWAEARRRRREFWEQRGY